MIKGGTVLKGLLKIYIPIIVMTVFFQGCTKPEENEFSKVHKMLSGLENYTVTAEIIVRGNKLVGNYVVKQYFKYPDKYRLEVVSPEDKKGKVTLYDGERIWIHNPVINQTYVMENFKEVEECSMFPGHFAKNLFSGEKAEYSIKKDKDGEFVAIRVEIPGVNSYRKYQILYFDKKQIVPVKMEILDSAGNVVVTVFYKDFTYNGEIEDRLFKKVTLSKDMFAQKSNK